MQKYLKRQVYDDLLAWKKQEDRATLEVSGARQVGKTYIVNKFADIYQLFRLFRGIFLGAL